MSTEHTSARETRANKKELMLLFCAFLTLFAVLCLIVLAGVLLAHWESSVLNAQGAEVRAEVNALEVL